MAPNAFLKGDAEMSRSIESRLRKLEAHAPPGRTFCVWIGSKTETEIASELSTIKAAERDIVLLLRWQRREAMSRAAAATRLRKLDATLTSQRGA